MSDCNLPESAKKVAARSLSNMDVHAGIPGMRLGMTSKVVPGQFIVQCHVPRGAESLAAAADALYESACQIGPLTRNLDVRVTYGNMNE
jgi:hypothetical protein